MRFPATWILVACLAGEGVAQEPAGGDQAGGQQAAGQPNRTNRPGQPRQARNRDRWNQLSPERREKLRAIYRELQKKLPPEERKRLFDRLRSLKESERKKAIEHARERVRRRNRQGTANQSRKKSPREVDPRRGPRNSPGSKRQQGKSRPARSRPSPQEIRDMETRLQRTMKKWIRQLPPEMRDRVQLFTRREQAEFFRNYRVSGILVEAFPNRPERESLLKLSSLQIRMLWRADTDRPKQLSVESWDRWQSLKVTERRLVCNRLEKLRRDRAQNSPGIIPRRPGVERRKQQLRKEQQKVRAQPKAGDEEP